jgi:pimeloyl-ACP methyl ester carboxylesterase
MPYVNSQDVRIHYQVESAGPPLVLLHGFSDSLESWYEQGYVEALKPDYQVILLDARGHGASGKPHDPGAYDMSRHVADILAVLDALQVPTAHFWGYSMGGQVGFGLAQHAPKRFASLIIGGADPYQGALAERDQWLSMFAEGHGHLRARLGGTGADLARVADTPAGERRRGDDRPQDQVDEASQLCGGLANHGHAVFGLCRGSGRGSSLDFVDTESRAEF